MAETENNPYKYKWQGKMEVVEVPIEHYQVAMIKEFLREGEYISSNCATDILHTKRPLTYKRVLNEISDKLRELE